MATPNKYEILGIAQDADQREVRAAYRKLAMQHHPDKGGDKEEFQKIQGAYETLGDEDARKQYDFQLKNPQQFGDFPGGFPGGGFPGGGFPGGFPADFGGFSGGGFADFFGGGGGGFADLFGGGGGRGGPPGGFPGGFNFFGGGGDEGFGDDDQFEDFINAGFSSGRGRQSRNAPPSWFFDFDMDDDEYFARQNVERAQEREKREKMAEEMREKRRIAKEQWQAEKVKRQADKPINNHKKVLRKNVLKLVDKEAPELDRGELEDALEKISAEDMEALWVVLSDRGSRTVCDCVVDALASFGIQITAPKAKKSKKKKAAGKAKAGEDGLESAGGEAVAEPKAAAASAKPKAASVPAAEPKVSSAAATAKAKASDPPMAAEPKPPSASASAKAAEPASAKLPKARTEASVPAAKGKATTNGVYGTAGEKPPKDRDEPAGKAKDVDDIKIVEGNSEKPKGNSHSAKLDSTSSRAQPEFVGAAPVKLSQHEPVQVDPVWGARHEEQSDCANKDREFSCDKSREQVVDAGFSGGFFNQLVTYLTSVWAFFLNFARSSFRTKIA